MELNKNSGLFSSYLAHHSILGQKWGVRRFQNKDGSLTSAGKSRMQQSDSQNKNKPSTNRQNGKELVNNCMKTIGKQKVSNLTGDMEDFAPLVIQASVYLGFTATMLGISKIREKKQRADKLRSIEERYEESSIKNLKDLQKLKKPMSPTESMKLVNPDYPQNGNTMNCTLCTIAMSMREKGYNVRAGKEYDGMYTDDLLMKTFNSENMKFKGKNNKETVLNTLQSQGEGAYGDLTLRWQYGGGHSIFWKNENGKTHIYDAQSGEEYKSSNGSLDQIIKAANIKQSSYNRLDNCEPNNYVLGLIENMDEKGGK